MTPDDDRPLVISARHLQPRTGEDWPTHKRRNRTRRRARLELARLANRQRENR